MEHIGKRMEKHVQVEYVFQELDKIPAGFQIPKDRVKPWGTGHAILCCKDVVDGPFAVVNADDYYGKSAFKQIYNQLVAKADDDKYQYTMVGYQLYNCLLYTSSVYKRQAYHRHDAYADGSPLGYPSSSKGVAYLCRKSGFSQR